MSSSGRTPTRRFVRRCSPARALIQAHRSTICRTTISSSTSPISATSERVTRGSSRSDRFSCVGPPSPVRRSTIVGSPDWFLFRDGVRLDFQITDRTEIAPNAYRNGYRVLIDKDGMMNTLVRPTFDAFVVRLPDRTTFETRAREFWWDATYVPKYLLRDELPFAKYMLDHVLRHEFLQPMVEWFIAVHHVGPVETGVCGRWFKRYLDPQTWGELESTYAGAGRKENAESYRRMVRLYRRLARDVAGRFGYDYPEALDRDVTEYCEGILHRLPIGAEHGTS